MVSFKTNKFFVLITLIALLFLKSFGLDSLPGNVVDSAALTLEKENFSKGDTLSGSLFIRILKGWHINSNKPRDKFLIPTRLLPDTGITIIEQQYPPADTELVMGDTSEIFKTSLNIRFKIYISSAYDPLKSHLILEYQGCNDKICLMPKKQSLMLPGTFSGQTQESYANDLGNKLKTLSPIPRILFLFLMGVILSFNPCVFPIIPITVTFFINQGKSSTARIILLGFLYMFGMAALFSSMGIMAALTGELVSFLFQKPLFLVAIALLLLVFALNMFGLFEIRLPSFLSPYGRARQGYLGALIMGVFAGLFTLPCTSGPLMALISLTAMFKSIFWGLTHFMALGFGIGTPFFFLSLFSGRLSSFPKSGDWMMWIKKFFAFLILGVALFFVKPLIGTNLFNSSLIILIVVSALFLSVFDKSGRKLMGFAIFKWSFSFVLIALCLWYVAKNYFQKTPSDSWPKYSASSFKSQIMDKNIGMIDFTAEWCTKCKQLERLTFSDKTVKENLKAIALFRVDLTFDTEENRALTTRFNVTGLPAIIFVDTSGKEIPGTRIEGYLGPLDFIKHLKKIY